MEIKVLCQDCTGCQRIAEIIKEEALVLGIPVDVENVGETSKIARFTTETPGILIDDVLRHSGRPQPSREKLRQMLLDAKAEAQG